MIVVLMTEGVLIMGVFIVPLHLLDKTALEEEGKGSVDGGLGDPDAFAPHALEEFLRSKMSVEGENLAEDPLSLLGELETLFVEKLSEYLFFHRRILMKKGDQFQFLTGRPQRITLLSVTITLTFMS